MFYLIWGRAQASAFLKHVFRVFCCTIKIVEHFIRSWEAYCCVIYRFPCLNFSILPILLLIFKVYLNTYFISQAFLSILAYPIIISLTSKLIDSNNSLLLILQLITYFAISYMELITYILMFLFLSFSFF